MKPNGSREGPISEENLVAYQNGTLLSFNLTNDFAVVQLQERQTQTRINHGRDIIGRSLSCSVSDQILVTFRYSIYTKL